MSQLNKLVVYYSCFNYEVDNQDFSHIENLRNIVLESLGKEWVSSLQRELELLNISLAKHCLELCCEVYLCLNLKHLEITYENFKEIFINELLLTNIWTFENPECNFLDELLQSFFNIAKNAMIEPSSNYFRLLPSVKKLPELQPLVIAEEDVTTLSKKICHILKKATLPFESLIGPEFLAKLSNYVKCLSSRIIKTHQVTSNFVINIIEIKPSINDLKVRVIQPAKEFYDKVIDSWIEIHNRCDSTYFLLELRKKLGADWKEKYVSPALYFYEIAQEEWLKTKGFGYNYFARRLQERMIDLWRQAIVETSKLFQEHMITKTII